MIGEREYCLVGPDEACIRAKVRSGQRWAVAQIEVQDGLAHEYISIFKHVHTSGTASKKYISIFIISIYLSIILYNIYSLRPQIHNVFYF